MAGRWLEEPRGNRFTRLEPRLRDTFESGGHGDDASDDGAGGVAVAETADGGPERILIVVEMVSGSPQAERDCVLGGDPRAISENSNGLVHRRI